MSRSRSRHSRTSSVAPVPYLPQIDNLILPHGVVDQETAELLQDFVHPMNEETVVNEEATNDDIGDELVARANLPWWKRPSPFWLIVALPFTSITLSLTLAPRIEIYTILACSAHKPEYTMHLDLSKQLGLPYVEDSVSKPLLDFGASAFIPTIVASERESSPIYFTSSADGSNHNEADDRRSDRCASDPAVQAAVAKLTAVMTASMGIISCLTTAWWGSFSDRHGRTRVMLLSVIGLLLTDFNFIFVSLFSKKLPGGYWFLVVGPAIEGCMGGLTSGMAVMHAYVADTTDPGTRARAFSLFLGLMFIGLALGPALGGVLIHATHNILSVFYLSAILHLTHAAFVLLIVPESLYQTQMIASRVRHRERRRELKESRDSVVERGILVRIKRLFGFLSPLTMLMPAHVEGNGPLKYRKRDWNLTLVAIVYGSTNIIMGSVLYKLQYASAKFHWSSETLGYILSMMGITRAAHLAVILPAVIKLLKPKPPPVESPPSVESSQPQLPSSPSKDHNSLSFDLNLARVSLAIEMICYTLIGLAPTPVPFTIFTMLGSLGAGLFPALQSVALELYSRRGGKESGRLFGALSVLQALGSQIIGPAVFGFTYISSVAVLPAAIFYLCTGIALVALVLLGLIHILKDPAPEEVIDDEEDQVVNARAREETLVDIQPEPVETNLGRKSKTNLTDSSLVDV